MTRGGVRKGAGRPTSKGEKRTANLCGIRVTPSQLAAYKAAAASESLSFTDWVLFQLNKAAGAAARHDEHVKDLYDKVIAELPKKRV